MKLAAVILLGVLGFAAMVPPAEGGILDQIPLIGGILGGTVTLNYDIPPIDLDAGGLITVHFDDGTPAPTPGRKLLEASSLELSNSAADVIAEDLAEEKVSAQGRKVRAGSA